MKIPIAIIIAVNLISQPCKAQITITEMETQTNQTLRLWFHDENGGADYTVQFCPGLSGSNDWKNIEGAVVTGLGENLFQVAALSATNTTGFFRVLSAEELRAWFEETNISFDEGRGTITLTIRFNGHYNGVLTYIVEGTGIDSIDGLSGTVEVAGDSAEIVIQLKDNADINQLRYVSISLQGSTSVKVSSSGTATVNILENDAIWQGILETETGTLGFQLEMIDDGSMLIANFSGGDFGFFPSNPIPATVSLSETVFSATITNIPVSSEATLLDTPMVLELSLLADENLVGGDVQHVGNDQIEGSCQLAINIPTMPYLNATNQGSFVLQKPPVAPSTNEVELVEIP